MGERARRIPQESIGPEEFGATGYNEVTKKPTYIRLSDALTDQKTFNDVYGHEIGHAIDQMVGEIPITGVEKEARDVFHTLNTGKENSAAIMGPEQFRYDAENVPRELMAESIRAYMENPNYLKTVAPNVAKRIREHVNGNPDINKNIQFNALGDGSGMADIGFHASGVTNQNQNQEDNQHGWEDDVWEWWRGMWD